jgi:cobalamin biosynthesis protein CbiD
MAITIDPRTAHAPQTQTVLTKHGCIIKTRLGLHEVHSDSCSERGLIILHICAELDKIKDLERELLDVEGVNVKYMQL